jgi:hypothetical protein
MPTGVAAVRVRLDVTMSARVAAVRVAVAVALAVPAVAIRLAGAHLPPLAGMAVFGLATLSAVALLMWATEIARVDMPGSLSLALLALVAVLPEYAVDVYFAYVAGSDATFASFALANMTGANRLLIGVAWPLLVFVAIWAVRRRGRQGDRDAVRLAPHRRTETVYLLIATAYALVIPATGRLAWYDSIVLGGLFSCSTSPGSAAVRRWRRRWSGSPPPWPGSRPYGDGRRRAHSSSSRRSWSSARPSPSAGRSSRRGRRWASTSSCWCSGWHRSPPRRPR